MTTHSQGPELTENLHTGLTETCLKLPVPPDLLDVINNTALQLIPIFFSLADEHEGFIEKVEPLVKEATEQLSDSTFTLDGLLNLLTRIQAHLVCSDLTQEDRQRVWEPFATCYQQVRTVMEAKATRVRSAQ